MSSGGLDKYFYPNDKLHVVDLGVYMLQMNAAFQIDMSQYSRGRSLLAGIVEGFHYLVRLLPEELHLPLSCS